MHRPNPRHTHNYYAGGGSFLPRRASWSSKVANVLAPAAEASKNTQPSLPGDCWLRIVAHLPSTRDLLNLRLASRQLPLPAGARACVLAMDDELAIPKMMEHCADYAPLHARLIKLARHRPRDLEQWLKAALLADPTRATINAVTAQWLQEFPGDEYFATNPEFHQRLQRAAPAWACARALVSRLSSHGPAFDPAFTQWSVPAIRDRNNCYNVIIFFILQLAQSPRFHHYFS